MPKFYSDVDINSPAVTISSVTGNKPLLTLTTTDNTFVDNSSEIKFFKNSASEAGEDLGLITWRGLDSGGAQTKYCEMKGEILVNTDSDELGKLSLIVRNEGSYLSGFVAKGTTTTGEVNVDLANGSASTTTIAGDLSITTGLLLDSVDITTIQTDGEAFADNNTSLMTSAAIDDRITAAGGGVTVSDSTADTDFPVVFHDESNGLLDDDGSFTYNPDDGKLVVLASIEVPSVLATAASGTGGGRILLQEGSDNGTNFIGFRAPAALSGNTSFELPNGDGSANQVLKTNGSGVLSWTNAGSGGGLASNPYSSTLIKVLPTEFVANEASGRGMTIDDSGQTTGIRTQANATLPYAFVRLPDGYKATDVKVNTSTQVTADFGSYNYTTGVMASALTGGTPVNTNSPQGLDTDVPASATQDLYIKVIPGSTSVLIYGAIVTIATI